jgi:chromate transporter
VRWLPGEPWSRQRSSPWVLLRFLGRRAQHPRAKGAIQAVVLASAALLWVAALPLGREAITDPVLVAILILGARVLATRKVESIWVILGSGGIYLGAASLRVVPGVVPGL